MSEPAFLLGVDTSAEGDLALARLLAHGELELVGRQQFSGRQQATELLPRLRQLLASAGVTLADVAALVVVAGPGSFTGLRIGLGAVKGLAEGGSIPVIALSSLAVLGRGHDRNAVIVAEAGRAAYYVRTPQEENAARETLETGTSIAALLQGNEVVVANAVLAGTFPQAASVTVGESGAWQAMQLALPRLRARDFDDVASLDANYVRRPYTETVAPAQ